MHEENFIVAFGVIKADDDSHTGLPARFTSIQLQFWWGAQAFVKSFFSSTEEERIPAIVNSSHTE